MKYSPNFGLGLPERIEPNNDRADIDVLSDNFSVVDGLIQENKDSAKSANDTANAASSAIDNVSLIANSALSEARQAAENLSAYQAVVAEQLGDKLDKFGVLDDDAVVITGAGGEVMTSDITPEELGMLKNAQSNIQAQLDYLKSAIPHINYLDGIGVTLKEKDFPPQDEIDGEVIPVIESTYPDPELWYGVVVNVSTSDKSARKALLYVYFDGTIGDEFVGWRYIVDIDTLIYKANGDLFGVVSSSGDIEFVEGVGIVLHAKDSDTLGEKEPDYFASEESVAERVKELYEAIGSGGGGGGLATIKAGSGRYSETFNNGTEITTANGEYAHAEGLGTTAFGYNSHAEGNKTNATGDDSHAEGLETQAVGNGSHTEGRTTVANGVYSHAEGYGSQTGLKSSAHAEGRATAATGEAAHSEGKGTRADGDYSHAEGDSCEATGPAAHAEGKATTAVAEFSHAEGWMTQANDSGAHAEGSHSVASGVCSHAEGGATEARGAYSHSQGTGTTALGEASFAGGNSSTAAAINSMAMGEESTTLGRASAAIGYHAAANGYGQFSCGSYNSDTVGWSPIDDVKGALFIVGNGTSETNRSNAFVVNSDGSILINPTPGQGAMEILQDLLLPTGIICVNGRTEVNDIPSGWLRCNGAAVSRTQYARLFSAIGTGWGAGDGSTTFNVPNLNGRFVYGSGGAYTPTATGGATTVSLTAAQNGPHTHTTLISTSTGGVIEGNQQFLANIGGTTATGSSGTGAAHENMPPYVVATYIIKA